MHSIFQLDCPGVGLRVVLLPALISFFVVADGWILSGDLGAKPAQPGENRSDYLGQDPPGLIPKVFAPGIVSTEDIEFKIAINPDGKYLFYNSGGDIFWVDISMIDSLKPD
jgi:hypothetical protein